MSVFSLVAEREKKSRFSRFFLRRPLNKLLRRNYLMKWLRNDDFLRLFKSAVYFHHSKGGKKTNKLGLFPTRAMNLLLLLLQTFSLPVSLKLGFFVVVVVFSDFFFVALEAK